MALVLVGGGGGGLLLRFLVQVFDCLKKWTQQDLMMLKKMESTRSANKKRVSQPDLY